VNERYIHTYIYILYYHVYGSGNDVGYILYVLHKQQCEYTKISTFEQSNDHGDKQTC